MLTIYADPAIEFFDVFLKGDRPVESFPRVQWHHGHVGYREADSWPPPGAQTFLSRLADAAAAGTGGHLGGEPAGADESVEWSYDPSDLVPSTVENSFAYLHDYPDEPSLLARHDALTFYAEPTTAPVDLAGPVSLALRVDSSAPTADVFVKLYDVDAGGVAKLVARGQGTVLEPGADRTVEIGMGPWGTASGPGHGLLPRSAPQRLPGVRAPPGDIGEPVDRGADVGGGPPHRGRRWDSRSPGSRSRPSLIRRHDQRRHHHARQQPRPPQRPRAHVRLGRERGVDPRHP